MTYIIGEAGTGHYAICERTRYYAAQGFIEAAFNAGADAVKFQLFVPDEPLFCSLPGDDERMENRWRFTFMFKDEWLALKLYGESLGVDVLWSVFQPTAVEWLKDLKPKYVKVASRAAQSFPYHSIHAPFIVSMGMGKASLPPNAFRLSCVSKYPTPLEEAKYYEGRDGLSDHSGTPWPGLDAIYHGAKFLEVHFKIPGADMGNDTPACITVDQLKLLCEARDAVARMHAA